MRLTELRWAKGKYLLSSYFMPSIVPGTSYTLSYLVSLIPDWKIVSSYCYGGKRDMLFHCMLLLLLSHFSRVRLCATEAHQASPSMGFSRQEHWSGLPFPSPSMKVKSESEVAQSCPTLSDPMDCSLPGSSVHGICQARVLEWGAIAFSCFTT